MKIKPLNIAGSFLIENFMRKDKRGLFIKPFKNDIQIFKELSFEINEIYFSISKKNVIRGMHFQRPPMNHAKLIYLTSGSITDLLLDLRKSSQSYKKYIAINLSAYRHALFIPSGIAHGFKVNNDNTTVIYNQSSVYSKKHDDGILWNSFGFDWEINSPILSDRDKSFITIDKFDSPFD